MNIEDFRNYCVQKPGTTEEFPFDNQTLVFKVGGRMYALCDIDQFESINLKCDPELAVQLREEFDAVCPGYHMNKKHWNTVIFDGTINDRLILEWTDLSYQLVVNKLPLRIRENL
jgi:predicted DNA-binding protein (MmcQ/YjbR family)